MGHYRSEMGFEAEDERRAKAREAQQKKRAAYIKADIEKRGIENVLADIIDKDSWYSVRTL